MRITIIGAGPGGYTAAFEAAKKGAEVTLVEAKNIGGTCLNHGCIPTKSLKASAERLEAVRHAGEFGIRVQDVSVDMSGVMARKRHVVSTLTEGLKKNCARLNIRTIMGKARVLHAGLVRVQKNSGECENIEGDRIILAMGSAPMQIPTLPIDNMYFFSSDAALELTTVPQSLTIVGGGVIGCELAGIFHSLGSQVTVVEGQGRLLPVPSVDQEMSKFLLREMKKKRIATILGHTITHCDIHNGKVRATLGPSPFLSTPITEPDGPQTLLSDALFITVGRIPLSTDAGLEEAGIALDNRGYVIADEYLQTSVPGIYAVGDILGPQRIMLAHMAAMEGIIAAENCLGGHRAVDYSVVPSGIFVSPEIGTVGLTEAQAREQGYDVITSSFVVRELGKAQAMGELSGLFKLVADKRSGKILGAHLAGARSTDIIAELALALKMGATVQDLAWTIHAHPTLAEGIFEAARAFGLDVNSTVL